MKEKEKKKLGVKGIISIIFSVFFILIGIAYLSDIFFLSILMLLAGIILIPSVNEKVKNSIEIENGIYGKLRIAFVVLTFFAFFGSIGTEDVSEVSSDNLLVENTAINQVIEEIIPENEVLENIVNEDILKLENTIAERNKTIETLENTITNTVAKVTELESEISNKVEQITNLEESVNTLKEEKNTLENKLSSANKEIEKASTATSSSTSSSTSTSMKSTKSTTTSSSTTSTTTNNSYTVYVTNTGSKYHRAGCSYLKSSNPISKSDAIAQGYSACSRCNP